MRIGEALQRIEQIYRQLEEECFTFVGTIVSDEADVDQRLLEELMELLGYLHNTHLYDHDLLCDMLTLLDYGNPIYQLATCRLLTLEGLEDKMDVLAQEKKIVEQTLAKLYYEQRRQLLQQARTHLRQLERSLQALIYAKYHIH
ncbi:hypothetical protein ACFOU2_14455 [Bacillus songklensis]|uniref:Uncharacterized protein n=1 Tax=Bacillus songklensis TaxID=1069116 RepID=A0ABV8B5H8_9BACI